MVEHSTIRHFKGSLTHKYSTLLQNYPMSNTLAYYKKIEITGYKVL